MAVCWIEFPEISNEKCTFTLQVNDEVLSCNRESGHEKTNDLNRTHYAENQRVMWLVTEEGDIVIQSF